MSNFWGAVQNQGFLYSLSSQGQNLFIQKASHQYDSLLLFTLNYGKNDYLCRLVIGRLPRRLGYRLYLLIHFGLQLV